MEALTFERVFVPYELDEDKASIQRDKKIASRIESLGRLNDRRDRYLLQRNRRGLLLLAAQYDRKKMPMMAAEIRKEAETI